MLVSDVLTYICNQCRLAALCLSRLGLFANFSRSRHLRYFAHGYLHVHHELLNAGKAGRIEKGLVE